MFIDIFHHTLHIYFSITSIFNTRIVRMDFGIPDLPVIDISSTWDEPGKVVKSARSFKKSKALNLKTNNKLKNNKVITPPSINGR